MRKKQKIILICCALLIGVLIYLSGPKRYLGIRGMDYFNYVEPSTGDIWEWYIENGTIAVYKNSIGKWIEINISSIQDSSTRSTRVCPLDNSSFVLISEGEVLIVNSETGTGEPLDPKIKDSLGDIRFCTISGSKPLISGTKGFLIFESGGWREIRYPNNDIRISAFFHEPTAGYWIITSDAEVFLFNTSLEDWSYLGKLQKEDWICFQIDSSGYLWAKRPEGVFRFSLHDLEEAHEKIFPGVSTAVCGVYEDMEGRIWIPTHRGIWRYQQGELDRYSITSVEGCAFDRDRNRLYISDGFTFFYYDLSKIP